MVVGGCWWSLVVVGGRWWLLVVVGGCWWSLVVVGGYDSLGQFFVVKIILYKRIHCETVKIVTFV